MYKKLLLAAIAAGTLALAGCASDGASDSASGDAAGAADVFGTQIYLRGEMNDWNAQSQYLITKVLTAFIRQLLNLRLTGLHISLSSLMLVGLLVLTSVTRNNLVYSNGVEILSF